MQGTWLKPPMTMRSAGVPAAISSRTNPRTYSTDCPIAGASRTFMRSAAAMRDDEHGPMKVLCSCQMGTCHVQNLGRSPSVGSRALLSLSHLDGRCRTSRCAARRRSW
jgi:hypothetical protein